MSGSTTMFAGFVLLVQTWGMYPENEPVSRDRIRTPIASRYQEAAERIIRATLSENDAWDKLEELCLVIGPRLSGSEGHDRAVDWALRRMREDGQENVRPESVMVPRWVRGEESLTMLAPHQRKLSMLGLGGSVGTAATGVSGEVIVVGDEAELEAAGSRVAGKIVLFNKAMPPYDPVKGSGYGATVHYRTHGARLAAEKGGVACLVRSVTAGSLYTPHTGALLYQEGIPEIPAAAVTIEDAELMAGLQRRGIPVRVNLQMEARTLADAPSANVIGELRGTVRPDEIVVIGGHLDSWDVGHGAQDDGGGCVIAMEAINVLRKLGLTPRRTIRVVLWTNEENGLRGAKAYARQHAHELEKHVAAIESDSGIFEPRGFSAECEDPAKERLAAAQLQDMLSLLAGLGPMEVATGWSGADVSTLKPGGAVLMGHRVEGSTYFNFHHTHADTLDKVDPEHLSKNVAALAVVAYIIADMPTRIGETPATGTR